MGELMGMQGGRLEVEQGLGEEACQRWLGGAQGEATVVTAVQQAVIDGLGNTNLARYPVMHLEEWWSQMRENFSIDELPQGETGAVADDSGPETTEESDSQLGDDPHRKYWVQWEDGLKVTAAGLASEDEVGEDRQHEGQDGQPGKQDWQVLSAEQHESMVEAKRDESLTRQCG